MKTTSQTRLARLAGLVLLSMLVFAIGVQAAAAAVVAGSGAGSGAASFTSTTQLQGLTAANAALRDQGVIGSVTAATAPAGTQGRGGVAVAAVTPSQPQGLTAAQRHHYFGTGRFQPTSNVLAAQPASTGATSRSAWIAAGSAAAIVLIGFAAWALTRRRRQPGDRASAAYCAQHPEDAMCTAA